MSSTSKQRPSNLRAKYEPLAACCPTILHLLRYVWIGFRRSVTRDSGNPTGDPYRHSGRPIWSYTSGIIYPQIESSYFAQFKSKKGLKSPFSSISPLWIAIFNEKPSIFVKKPIGDHFPGGKTRFYPCFRYWSVQSTLKQPKSPENPVFGSFNGPNWLIGL